MKSKAHLALFLALLLLFGLVSCKVESETYSICKDGHDLVEHPLVAATCTEDGLAAHTECTRCHAVFDEGGKRTSLAELTIPAACTPDGVWSFDESAHFQTCLVCGETTLAGKHRFENGVCAICGAIKEETDCAHRGGKATCLEKAICELCGKPYGRLAGHTKVNVVDARFLESEATCTKRASYHASCALCGFVYAETFPSGDALGHIGTATCLQKAVCERCGETFGSLGAHDFSMESVSPETFAAAATCSFGATYYKTCSVCGKVGKDATFVSGLPIPENHTFVTLDSETDETHHTLVCSLCGVQQTAQHTGSEGGTCMDQTTCTVCGRPCPAAPHNFNLQTPSPERLASEATCQSPATYYFSCSVCGVAGANTFSHGQKADHHYENGVCIWCNKEE